MRKLFLSEVYAVAAQQKETITIDNKVIKVTMPLYRECRLFRILHNIMAGVTTVFAIVISNIWGGTSFIKDIIFIVILLFTMNYIYNYLIYFLLKRKFAHE